MAADWRGLSVPGWAVKRVDLWRFLDCCPMSMPAFGGALNEEAERARSAECGARNVLLGYSMGGRLALHALLAGGPWDAAVIVSAHAGLEEEREKAARRKHDAAWAAKALKGDWRDFLEAWDGQGVLKREGNEGLAMPDRRPLETRRGAVARSFMDWSLGVQEPLWDRLGKIACPVLWVAGEKDAKFRTLAARAMACGGFESWIAPGAGHRVPWESADFPRIVGEFLERSVS